MTVVLALAAAAALPAAAPAATQTVGGGQISNINGPGNPYPSTTASSGLAGSPTKVTATLNVNFLDGQTAQDLDALLIGPGGQRVMLISDTCLGSLGPAALTIDDAAAAPFSPIAPCPTGSYVPTNGVSIDEATEMPVPGGLGPFSTQMAAFNAGPASGTWSLFTRDDQNNVAFPIISSWSVTITTADPPVATTPATTAAKCPKGKKLKKVKGKRKCVRKKRKRKK